MNIFDTFLESIQKESVSFQDEIVKMRQLRSTDTANQIVHLVPEGPPQLYRLTNRAEGLLLARTDLPAAYLHRCPHSLYRENLDYWLKRARKEAMLRCIITGGPRTCRAVVGPRFDTSKDDVFVFPIIIQGLRDVAKDNEDLAWHFGMKYSHFTILKVSFKESAALHNGLFCTAGITISNSEVGLSCLTIQPSIRAGWQVPYDFIDSSSEGTTMFRHVGELEPIKVLEAIERAREVSEIGISTVLKISTETVQDPGKECLEFIKNTPAIPNRIGILLEQEWKKEEHARKFDLATSILAACEKLPVFQKYQAQQEVGRYIGLFQSSAARLQNIIEKDIEGLEAA
jgi:hypothetical protein